MDEKNQEDSLDRQLREAAPYIDDQGFSARVLAALPAPRRKQLSLRSVILIGITLLGSTLAYVLSDGGRFVTVKMVWLASLPTVLLLAVAFGSGILVTAGGLIAAISKSRELQS
ncbi:MAG: hypothetical protein M3R29_05970 [Verrucomicrobiota bacterium]|nr:hypothetical protein [Verrucomicrobiota bacterium]